MSAAQTSVELTRALAWPLVVLASVLVLRQQLRGVLSGLGERLAKLKAPGLELEFARVGAETEAVLGVDPTPLFQPVADREAAPTSMGDPTAMVLAEYARVGQALREILDQAQIEVGSFVNPLKLATIARKNRLITEKSLEAVRGVTVMRNLAAHGQGNLDAGKVADYIALIDATIYSFRDRADLNEPSNLPTNPSLGLDRSNRGSIP